MKAEMSVARSYELARRVMRQPILTITLAAKTGWALHWDPDHVTSGVESFGSDMEPEIGPRVLRFRNWLRELLSLAKPGLVVYERPVIHQGLRRKALPAAIQLEGVLLAELEVAFHRGLDMRYASVPPALIRDSATGRTKPHRSRLLWAARQRWKCEVQDEHHAEALCMLALTIDQSGVGAKRQGAIAS